METDELLRTHTSRDLVYYIEACSSSFSYETALKTLSVFDGSEGREETRTYYVKNALHTFIENIVAGNDVNKGVALFIKANYEIAPLDQRKNFRWWCAQFHQWTLFSMDLSKQVQVNQKLQRIPERDELIRNMLKVLHSNNTFLSRWNWGKWLLLLRLLPRLSQLKIALDARIVTLILSAAVDAGCTRLQIGTLLGCLLASATFPDAFCDPWNKKSLRRDRTFRTERLTPNLWVIVHRCAAQPSSIFFDAMDLRAFNVSKTIIATLDTSLQLLVQTKWNTHTMADAMLIFTPYFFNLSNCSKVVLEDRCHGSYASPLTVTLRKNQFSIYQVITPHFFQRLRPFWEWPLRFACPPFQSTPILSIDPFHYHKGVDSHQKPFHLEAIFEAERCDRSRHRHGACLAVCSCSTFSNDINSAQQTPTVLSTGRNKVVKDPKKVHRSGAVQHAEVVCLLKALHQKKIQWYPTTAKKPMDNMRRKRSKMHEDRHCIYIIELDNFDIGYCASHACPLCTSALQKLGIHAQHYSTPEGFKSQRFPFLPSVQAPTLDFSLPVHSKA